jgi:hypothetical protein
VQCSWSLFDGHRIRESDLGWADVRRYTGDFASTIEMDESTEDNRRGVLSAAQHARLRALPRGASWWTRHVRALGSGANLAQLAVSAPAGLEADLADGRVIGADATLGLEPVPDVAPAMVVRAEGQTLSLGPGVWLPPGRLRVYYLPRSRWVVHGEARPEQWEDYRTLVLQAQHLDPAEVEALRAGRLPPRFRAPLRSRVRASWIPVLLWLALMAGVGVSGASVTWELLLVALLLGVVGSWAALRLVRVHRDASGGTVNFVEGPVHIEVVIGRQTLDPRLVVGGDSFRLTSSDAALVSVLYEGIPCRLYRTPTTGLFVAIEPLFEIHGPRE